MNNTQDFTHKITSLEAKIQHCEKTIIMEEKTKKIYEEELLNICRELANSFLWKKINMGNYEDILSDFSGYISEIPILEEITQ